LIQIVVLSRSLQNDIQLSLSLIASHGSDGSYDQYMQWSYTQLNLLITSMASLSKLYQHFFSHQTCHTFRPKFVDIYYKLKSLKVLSFLAIEPRLPIDLLAVIVSESFLWTEVTALDPYVMQLHSRLISHFSSCVKDSNTLNAYLRQDFWFQLNECLHFLTTHLHSFTDYLVNCLNKTQIELIVDNWDTNLINQFEVNFPEDNHFIDLFTRFVENESLLTNEEFLLPFLYKSLSG